MATMTSTLDRFAGAFDALGCGREGAAPAWLVALRRDALAAFLSQGLPTTRDEEWRHTSVAPLAEEPLDPAAGDGAASAPLRLPGDMAAAAHTLVFVNGRYAPALSASSELPAGVRVESLAAVVASGRGVDGLARLASLRHPFTALNTAFVSDGAVVSIAPHTVVDTPIHLWFVSANPDTGRSTVAHPRVLVTAGRDSRVSIVETYAGPDGDRYFSNTVTEVVAGDGAVVDLYKRQLESAAAFHIGALYVQAGRGAQVSAHSLAFGGALVRNEVVAVLDGEGAGCTLDGLYVADGDRLVDNHTTIDHAKPHGGSRELYKGILAGRARGVFNGKVIVRPDAQQTDARQTNRALLLSDHARINTKPQLEIFANDVKCTHGAAVGQLDEDAVFYLRSRGIGAGEARRMLVRAFAAEVVGRMRLDALRADADAALTARLAGLLPAAA